MSACAVTLHLIYFKSCLLANVIMLIVTMINLYLHMCEKFIVDMVLNSTLTSSNVLKKGRLMHCKDVKRVSSKN
jgi:hypothetical protein